MNKKELRACPMMSIDKFLRTYFEVDNEELINQLSTLNHKELKQVAKVYGVDLVSLNFNAISREMVFTGAVVLVRDFYENLAPYINPSIIYKDEYETTLEDSYIEGCDIDDKYQGKRKIK